MRSIRVGQTRGDVSQKLQLQFDKKDVEIDERKVNFSKIRGKTQHQSATDFKLNFLKLSLKRVINREGLSVAVESQRLRYILNICLNARECVDKRTNRIELC